MKANIGDWSGWWINNRPMRVFPGRFSVCRRFWDIEAKLERFEGNSKVVISDPDIKAFKI